MAEAEGGFSSWGHRSRVRVGTVKKVEVVPDSMGDRDEFRHERYTDQGTEVVIVDGSTGKKRSVFGPERLAKALRASTGAVDGAFDADGEPYVGRRGWDDFREHLLGAGPPPGCSLSQQ